MKRDTPEPPLGTLIEEHKLCLKAWRAYRTKDKWTGELAWCCHHNLHIQLIYGPPRRRIEYILDRKPWGELPSRLRSFRPVKNDWALGPLRVAALRFTKGEEGAMQLLQLEGQKISRAALRRLHDKQWPDNTWTGRRVLNT
jgi:hypothetical protein